MGKRVRVVSRQEKYGDREDFNWKQEEFKNLLDTLGCSVHEEDPEGYCDRWECQKEEFKQAIQNLKDYSNGVFKSEEWASEDVASALHELSYDEGRDLSIDPTSVINTMEKYLEECDKKSCWIIFVAW